MKQSSIGIDLQKISTVELPANDTSTIIDSKSVAKIGGNLIVWVIILKRFFFL